MGGKKSRDKGRKGENEFAKLVGGERISKIGLGGPDVRDKYGNVYEVKRPQAGLSQVYAAIAQANAESAAYVAMRSDNKEWFIVIPTLEAWLKLQEQLAATNIGVTNVST